MSEIKKLFKDKARAISKGQYKEAAEACNAIGSEYFNEEKYEEALEQHTEELELCETTGDQMSIAVANRRIGECYAELGNFKKALQHVRKFHDIAVSLKSLVEEQRAMATFGRTYFLKYQNECALGSSDVTSKSLDQAELAYYKALKLSYKLGSELKPAELAEMKSRLLLNLGLVYEIRGNYKESTKHVKQGLEIATSFNLDEEIRRCAFALGTLYQKVHDYQEAERAYDTALSAAKKFHNKSVICEIKLYKAITLICMEKYVDAKKVLKSAYKLHTANSEDHDKIIKVLKVCIGVSNYEEKIKYCKKYSEKKMLLEKIADGLSSIECYRIAIKKYLLTLKCMEEAGVPLSEKAPIYFSIAETYQDDGNIPMAIEYFEKEIECNKEKPQEQVETLWKIADILEKEKTTDKLEELYLKAVCIAEKSGNMKLIHCSLSKLFNYYANAGKGVEAEEVKKKLNGIHFEYDSEEESENEESNDLFSDVHLSELSDSDDNEERAAPRKRTKRIENKINEKGETPLHQACINGNFNMVKRLLESGHSVNVRDYCGWTPLHEACNYGFYNIVEYLLEKGANINDPGGPQCGGITALHDAASCGNLDVMELLIAKGASVTVVDKNGETPLQALLQWKKRSFGDLDSVTLRQCQAVEEELRSKMKEARLSVDDIDDFPAGVPEFTASPVKNCNGERKSGEKRARSPSMSPDITSSDDEIHSSPLYVNIEDNDWNDADNAKAEYKSVMENLRRSAAGISPVKIQVPKAPPQGPSLVNENEVIDEWLIKDTKEAPRTKKKKRRVAKLNVRTSKCIDNYLVPQDISETMETAITTNNSMVDEDSNCSITSVVSTGQVKEVSSSNALKKETAKVSFCLRVSIASKLILVPVPDDSCTVSWLSEEAAQRFQSLDGSKPHLIITKNGALLAGTDLVKDIFSNNEEVYTTVEAWEEPSLVERYTQLCTRRNVAVSSSVKKCLQCSENSSELNFSKCPIPSLHLGIIFNTLSNYKSLYYLNVSGVPLDININEFVYCIPSFSVIVTLNLSCCCLTSQSLKKFTDVLDNHASHTILPALRSLDLSFNNFSSSLPLSPILKLGSLISLNLSSCSVNSSFLSNETFCEILKNKHNLEDLDVSGNNLGDGEVSSLLTYLPKMNLKKLNLGHIPKGDIGLGLKLSSFFTVKLSFLTEILLQGCYLTDIDVNELAVCLSRCPALQVCDFSGNSSLSSESLCSFFNKAYENNLNITDVNVTGTCNWYDDCNLIHFLRFKNLIHLCIDNCTENVSEKLIESWTNKWGTRAICLNFGFYELSIT